ncbi:MAG: hypothetical protein V1767_02585 [Chloroflexota bacterium]
MKSRVCLALALIAGLCLAIFSPGLVSGGTNRFIYLNKFYGNVGDRVDVYGEGWDAGTYTVTFAYGSAFARQVISGTIYAGGIISTNINVPEAPGGQYTIRVQGNIEYYDEGFRIDPKVVLNKSADVVGTAVAVSGNGFGASRAVTLYFDDAQTGSATTNATGSFSNAGLTIPESAYGSHNIRATDSGGISGTTTFETRPSITINPTSGAVGDTVAVNGSGFNAGTNVAITVEDVGGGVAASNNKGSFSTSITIPNIASGARNIKATDSTNTATKAFSIAPRIQISPTSGKSGDNVTVTGKGFAPNQQIAVTYDGTEVAKPTSNAEGGFIVYFLIPASGGGNHVIRAGDKEANFNIAINATLTPTTGAVGQSVTINGAGFTAGGTVTINYDGAQAASATVAADGKFSANFNVPAGKGGAHTVIATQGANTVSLVFNMEATPPPVPKLVEPETDIKAKSRPTFDWENVTDPSGVTYTLQIADNETFVTNSIVLQKTGLTQTEYTLTGDEKLEKVKKESPYYWRVIAVDGASNASGPPEVRNFYVGGFSLSLPSFSGSWLTIVLIVVGVLVLLALGIWIGRRTAYF